MIILQTQLMGIHNDPGKITAVILRTEETVRKRNETYKGQNGGQAHDVSDCVAGAAGTEEDKDEFKEEMVLRENE